MTDLRNPAAVRALLDGTTKGPWQVTQTRHPWHLPAADQRKEMRGEHIERRIFSAWEHGQLKAPIGVVNGAYGIGASHMVSIDEQDARLIAAAPDLAAALADALDREARLVEIVRRIPNALNQAFAAGMEEREGGSARRQAKCMEPVEALRADASAALEETK